MKMTAASNPTTSPTIKAKTATVREKTMKSPSGIPVRAMFSPRKDLQNAMVSRRQSQYFDDKYAQRAWGWQA